MKETLMCSETNKYSNSNSKLGSESNFTKEIIEDNFINSFKDKQSIDLNYPVTTNKEPSIFQNARFDSKGIKICKGNNYHISFKSKNKFVSYINIQSYKNMYKNDDLEISSKGKSNLFSSSKNRCCIIV